MEQYFEWLFFNFMHFEDVFGDLGAAENGTKVFQQSSVWYWCNNVL